MTHFLISATVSAAAMPDTYAFSVKLACDLAPFFDRERRLHDWVTTAESAVRASGYREEPER